MKPPVPALPLRPERADKTRNRALIVEAAAAAFAETGVDTQMDDVATRAGVGVGTVYRHFATKDALMTAIVRRTFTSILDLTQASTSRAGEPFEIVKDVLRAAAVIAADNVVVQDAMMRVDGGTWDGVADLIDELVALMQVLFDRAQAAGTMRGDAVASDVPMLMCGLCAAMAAGSWDWRRHLEILLAGLSATAAQSERGELPGS